MLQGPIKQAASPPESQSQDQQHPQITTMKFLALALTILLAAGIQARNIQADAPTQVEQVQAALSMYLGTVKETAQKALNHLDDTEFKEYKAQLSGSLDNLQVYAQNLATSITPYSQALGTQFAEATGAIHAQVNADVEELRKQLQPKRDELRATVEKHVEEYRVKLAPLVQEYMAKHKVEMDGLKAKLEPIVEELRAKVTANVEETKSVLVPIVEAVRTKLTGRLEELRTMAAPYAEEYKEQLQKAIGEVREKVGPLTQDFHGQVGPYAEQLKEKYGPAAEDAKAKLMALYETISKAMQA